MNLVLEIEYLSGVCFAAIGPESEAPDWPPQPDRTYSALVATWGAGGETESERAALEWLETQASPGIACTDASARTAPVVFVPPNDARSDRRKNAAGVLPTLRSRQPRRFPAARPVEAIVRYIWADVEPDRESLAALNRLARDTSYIGHSASLTRCRFFMREADKEQETRAAERWVYRGRLVELRREFEQGRRPLSGASVRTEAKQSVKRASFFGGRWLLLEHVGGTMPDVRASALVGRAIRDALLSGYRRVGLEDRIPEEVSGHTVEGRPSQTPHLAIIALPFAGFPHADGHVMGFALVPPRQSGILDDEEFRRVLRTLAPLDDGRGRRILTVTSKVGTAPDRAFSIELSPAFEPAKRSLDPARYSQPSRILATVTPIVLDRHLKEVGDAREREIERLIAAACHNIGLPEPVRIRVDKHSAFEGAVSAAPSGRSPRWLAWGMPPSLAARAVVHAVLEFDDVVEGPVILGAGRYHGLGLCRSLKEDR